MTDTSAPVPTTGTALAEVGQIANQYAARDVFTSYRQRKAANTLRRHDADLALFAKYLAETGITAEAADLAADPHAWARLTWGLVEGFVRWQLTQGYAVGSVNHRLSTVKVYAKLAMKAGTLDATEYALIKAVGGYSRKEGKRINERRKDAELSTRRGSKKAEPVSLTTKQATALKRQPNTQQGRRDALLMCLLIDHGLRCGEVAALKVTDLDLKAGELRFYRPKVDKEQTHKLTPGTLAAARSYLEQDALPEGSLLRASRKGGTLQEAGMSERAITKRVRTLGKAVGLEGLSAHDCRHYWATTAARNGTPVDRLQDAGGWASPAMPLRYVEAAAIANEGVRLE